MRPVERGAVPQINGADVIFAHYRDARDLLMERIGGYCSYCEVPMPSGADVEHVQPKSRNLALERDWNNFLLGCTSCNSVKGARDVALDEFLWPDRDNTLRAFVYEREKPPELAPTLGAALQPKAIATLTLTGLNRHPAPGHPKPTKRDRRWLERDRMWRLAEHTRALLASIPAAEIARRDEAAGLIVIAAVGYGFFSVWMAVFAGDVPMRRRLLAAFAGTAANCFDGTANLVARPGGLC